MIRTFLLGAALAVASFAGPVTFFSGAGLQTELHAGAGVYNTVVGGSVEINPHTAWADEIPGGMQWISYAETGQVNGSAPAASKTEALFRVYQPIMATGFMNLTVWADDTAAVYLNDSLLPSDFDQPNVGQDTCAPTSIGCQDHEFGTFLNIAVKYGDTLRFDVYQVGTDASLLNNPTGLLYTGSAATPEPGTWALIAGGLGLLVGARRFARK